ncbi:MAG: ANTAR domain-containing protein [Sedimentitalea sp.]|uniref:ANTAR domain-containing response regulator n=1 Tax=Sedimentitalea sp. TaxID=2048915 RepID=UPI003267CE37
MSDLIQEIRNLHVMVALPREQSADELIQQVNRIGCQVEHLWPLPDTLLEKFDLVFLDVTDQNAERLNRFINSSKSSQTIVAVLGYENPSVLELILEIKAHSVLNKPVRASGVMTSMLLARKIQAERLLHSKAMKALKDKLENVQKVNDAKFVLMRHRGVNEREAYDLIRKQAMAKRATTADIAQAIINAESILSDFGGS